MHKQPRSLGTVSAIRVQVATESERMLGIAKRVGARLQHHLTRTADVRSLPDEDFRETWRFYVNTVVALQRYAADQPEAPGFALTDEQIRKEEDLITRERLRAMTPDERRELFQDIEHEPGSNMSMAPTSTPAPTRPAS